MQTVNDILELLTAVLQMDHIRFCKHGATAGHVGRFIALFPQRDEIFQDQIELVLAGVDVPGINGGGQTLGLLVNKRTGAGGTRAVGVEVGQFPLLMVYFTRLVRMVDLKEGRLLAAHADDGFDIRFYEQGANHLGDGLKFVWGIEPLAQLLAVISGK